MIKRLLFVLFLLLPSLAWSASPSITGTSGTFTDGQAITISGSGFGTKATAAPLGFEKFAGTSGTTITNEGISPLEVHHSENSLDPQYSNVQAHSGTTSALANPEAPHGGQSAIDYDYGAGSRQVQYYTWWEYREYGTIDQTAYLKSARSYFASPGYPEVVINYAVQNSAYYLSVYDSDGGGDFGALNFTPYNLEWVRWEIYFDQGTVNTSDGNVTATCYSAHARQDFSYLNKPLFLTGDALNYGFQIGQSFETVSGPYAYIDDLYWDLTRARVEICDNGTWASRTHCEIQPPSAWADGSVGITINAGSFATLVGTYLYVVDSSGVNSNGWLITGGAVNLQGGTVLGGSLR